LPIKKKSDLSADYCSAFSIGFRFLCQVYLNVPNETFIQEIFRNNLFFEWPVAENQEIVSRGLKILQDYSARWQPSLMEALKRDYTRLFIGLEKTLAPPYASVYLSEDHLLYGSSVLDVRQFYKKFGLSVNPMNRVPDDHIGFELYCLSFLLENAAQAALREFLSNHLNTWLPSFLRLVEEKAETAYYRGVALLTLGFVESLMNSLDIE